MAWLVLVLLGCVAGEGDTDTDTDTGSVLELQLSVSRDIACAVRADGVAACWGEGYEGPLPTLEGTYRFVAAGTSGVLAITQEGELECHDIEHSSALCQGAPVGGSYQFADVHGHKACAIQSDGNAVCWSERAPAWQVAGEWRQVRVGGSYTCFVGVKDKLKCLPDGYYPGRYIEVDVERDFALGVERTGALNLWGPWT